MMWQPRNMGTRIVMAALVVTGCVSLIGCALRLTKTWAFLVASAHSK